jgi:hypothetical protein
MQIGPTEHSPLEIRVNEAGASHSFGTPRPPYIGLFEIALPNLRISLSPAIPRIHPLLQNR